MSEISEKTINDKDSEIQNSCSTEEMPDKKVRDKSSYYYDDACGYETYEPGDDEETDDSDRKS